MPGCCVCPNRPPPLVEPNPVEPWLNPVEVGCVCWVPNRPPPLCCGCVPKSEVVDDVAAPNGVVPVPKLVVCCCTDERKGYVNGLERKKGSVITQKQREEEGRFGRG